jgi:PAS domain-containing protein
MSELSPTTTYEPRPALRLVRGERVDESESTWFCGRCAARVEPETVWPHARDCPACARGILVEARADAAPGADDAFMVVDSQLIVRAVSNRARVLFGVGILGQPAAHLLTAPDAEDRGGSREFIATLLAATSGTEEVHSLCLRPRGAFGVRVTARIARCGPPRSALVVLRRATPSPAVRLV